MIRIHFLKGEFASAFYLSKYSHEQIEGAMGSREGFEGLGQLNGLEHGEKEEIWKDIKEFEQTLNEYLGVFTNLISDDYVSLEEIDNCVKAINVDTSGFNDNDDSCTIPELSSYIVSSPSETEILPSILRVIEGT